MKKYVCLILCFVFFLFPFLNAFALYSERLEAPGEDNVYYYSDLNVFHKLGYGLPNCTAYAYGRAYEILGTAPKLSTGSAFRWFGYNEAGGYYPYGNIPKLGAIACFGGNTANPNGHVAVVEKIEDGYAHLSNSSWNGYIFKVDMRKLDAWNTAYKVGGEYLPFEGFIYVYDELPEDRFDFIIDGESAVITMFSRPESEVVIPEILDEKNVVGIGACAFWNNTFIERVVLHNQITTIGEKAFAGCENLKVVEIPESVTAIYENAFEGCENVVIKCKKNSYTHTFCSENGIEFDLSILFGDANNDGVVDILDLVNIAKYIVGSETEVSIDEADMNLNNTVDILDLVALAKLIVGEKSVQQ